MSKFNKTIFTFNIRYFTFIGKLLEAYQRVEIIRCR